jgi:hypothetical protein
MNRIIHDMDGEVRRGDSMLNPKFRGPDGNLQKFDIVVANPMWNQPIDPEEAVMAPLVANKKDKKLDLEQQRLDLKKQDKQLKDKQDRIKDEG